VKLTCYDDFVKILLESGFSLGGGNDGGIYAVVNFDWQQQPKDTPVRWHTGDRETDPWEWRLRVLGERNDIAYSKFFFRKSGYITREWIPFFLAARRQGKTFREQYAEGTLSRLSKRLYEVIEGSEPLPVFRIKRLAGVSKEDWSRADAALIDLQMGMFVTMCGTGRKRNRQGEEYGWETMVYTTAERFWGGEVFEEAMSLRPKEAAQEIRGQVLLLNANADQKKIPRFIYG